LKTKTLAHCLDKDSIKGKICKGKESGATKKHRLLLATVCIVQEVAEKGWRGICAEPDGALLRSV